MLRIWCVCLFVVLFLSGCQKSKPNNDEASTGSSDAAASKTKSGSNGKSRGSASAKSEAFNHWEYSLHWLDFECQGIEHFQQVSNVPPELKEKAAKSMREIFRKHTVGDGRLPWNHARWPMEQINRVNIKLKDPMINVCIALARNESRMYEHAIVNVDEAIPLLEEQKYPPRTMMMAHRAKLLGVLGNAQMRRRAVNAGQVNALIDNYQNSIVNWLHSDEKISSEQLRFALATLHRSIATLAAADSSRLEALKGSVESSPMLPKSLKLMGKGYIENFLAHSSRGTPIGDPGRKSNNAEFNQRQQTAAQYFQQVLDLQPGWPEPAVALMDIAAYENNENSVRYWFDMAVSRQYDFEPAYREMMNFLLAEYGGSKDEVIAFGEECYQQGKFETIVPFQYINTIDLLTDRRNQELWDRPGLFQTAIECMEKTYQAQKNATNPLQKDWLDELRSYQAAAASLSEQHQVAHEIYQQLGDRLVDEAPEKFGGRDNGVELSQLAAFESREISEDLKTVIRYWRGSNRDRMSFRRKIDLLIERGIENCQDENEKKTWFAYQTLNQQEKDYLAGQWVDLKFDNELLTWDMTNKEPFEVIDDSTLKVNSENASGFTMIRHRDQFDGPKCIEYEFELVKPVENESIGEPETSFWYAMATGRFDHSYRYPTDLHAVSYGLFARHSRVSVTATGYWTSQGWAIFNVPWQGKVSRHQVKIGREFLETSVDGEVDHYRVMIGRNSDTEIGFVALPILTPAAGEFIVRNVRVKRWKYPNELKRRSKVDDHYNYWSNRAQQKEYDRFAWEMTAWYAYKSKRYEKCFEACDRVKEIEPAYAIVDYYTGAIADNIGDMKKAFENYQSAAHAVIKRTHIANTNEPFSDYKGIQDVAASRYFWLLGTHKEFLDKEQFLDAFESLNVGYVNTWDKARIAALAHALKGEFAKAIALCEGTLDEAPEPIRAGIEAQIAAYKLNELYVPDESDQYYYRLWEFEIPDFNTSR